jgi:hypothetical protein
MKHGINCRESAQSFPLKGVTTRDPFGARFIAEAN